ncbi:MAG: RidA family protein [Congregibacter sp.]
MLQFILGTLTSYAGGHSHYAKYIAGGLLSSVMLCASVQADDATYLAPEGRSNTPYSESVIYGGFIFLAGKLGTVPGTGKLAEGGIGPQTRQTLENIKTALERVGGSMDSVLKCNVFLADIDEWAAMNAVYTTFFKNKPARTAIGNAGLIPGARVEIECMAAAPSP